MENDDKLNLFFKTQAQPLRKEQWFSERVMNRLPPNTKRKIRIIEVFIWCVSAVFGLSLCFIFGKSVTVVTDYKELFSPLNIFAYFALISVFGVLTGQIIKILRA